MPKLFMLTGDDGEEGDTCVAQCARQCIEQCHQVAEQAIERSVRDEEIRFRITALFLVFCCALLVQLLRVLVQEKARYVSHHIGSGGSFQDYLRYRFVHWFAWTPGSSGIVLCTVSLTLLIVSSMALTFTGRPMSSSLWASWVWISDPDGGNSAEDPFGCFIGLCVSVCGMLIFALLMSIVSDSIHDELTALRHGKYPVIEGDHLVILGNSPVLFILLEELCEAAESRGGMLIAILSSTSKPELEQSIQQSNLKLHNSQLVVRCGDMRREAHLEQVAVATAKTVIVLSDLTHGREEADCHTLQTLLVLGRMGWPREGCTVVQCALLRNQNLFGTLCSSNAEVLTIEDSVGQFLVQCSHQEGIADCFNKLVGFEGDEFYIQEIEGLEGWRFSDLLLAFPHAIPVGVTDNEGETVLLPPMDQVIGPGDRIVLLAEDASVLPKRACIAREEGAARIGDTQWASIRPDRVIEETIIILGWNETIGAILSEIDQLVKQGSHVLIFSPSPAEERKCFLEASQKRRRYRYQNITIEHREGHLGARYRLEELPINSARRIFILADSLACTPDTADMQTIASILQVQDIRRDNENELVIVPQILDRACESTLHHAHIRDIVNSNSMAARIIASIAEMPELSSVFGEILSETGAHFRLRGLGEYRAAMAAKAEHTGPLPPESTDEIEVSFQDVMRAAAACGEVALGWSRAGPDGCSKSSWEINPKDKFAKRPWDEAASRVLSLSPKVSPLQRKSSEGVLTGSPMRAFKRVVRAPETPWNVVRAAQKMKAGLVHRRRSSGPTLPLQADLG